MGDVIISHILPVGDDRSQWKFQSNEEHSAGVAQKAEGFANVIGMGPWGRVLGLFHDKGKEQSTFQQHIKKASNYQPDIRVDGDYRHAYVGALLAKQAFPYSYPLLSYPIMGHHAGLCDYLDFNSAMKQSIPLDVNKKYPNIKLELPKFESAPSKSDYNHLIRVLYSCLVDADYLDTESFMNPEQSSCRGGKKKLEDLLAELEKYLSALKSNTRPTPVNAIRQKVQQACADSADNSVPGFYSLTVPTGGGKTLSSLLWAMKHAVKYGKKRIIIAIPYTSIIVQTAAVLRGIFGDENVLEHHSNINTEESTNGKIRQQLKLATENWDYPIIVTTNVQLFESMYSNHPSDCRKLHNICNSVLILDEAQTLPIEYLQPVVDALKAYQRLFKTSVLFTTASQPTLQGHHANPNNPNVKLDGIESVKEIIPTDFKLYEDLQRVDIHMETGVTTPEDLAKKLASYDRMLCIVNTRKTAQEIFSHLPDEGLTLHLSRMMCPRHVSDCIAKIKRALASDEYPIIRVVSTQLIEAGVDIDFPVVFRQEAGLDSILQAAGRCNREGKFDKSDTYVFSLGKPLPPGFISLTNNARKNMLSKQFDWHSPEAMAEYFRQLYAQVGTFDKADMKCYLGNPRELQFETAAQQFKLIEDQGVRIIVNWHNSMDLVAQLEQEGPSYLLMKQLNQFTVNVYERDMKKLQEGGLIREIFDGIYVLPDREQYSEKVGLLTDNHWMDEILIK